MVERAADNQPFPGIVGYERDAFDVRSRHNRVEPIRLSTIVESVEMAKTMSVNVHDVCRAGGIAQRQHHRATAAHGE